MKFLFSLFAIVVMTESCKSTQQNLSDKMTEKEPSYNLQTLPSGSYEISQVGELEADAEQLVINFNDTSKQVSGFSGCNGFAGYYSINGSTIEFNDIASSKRLCEEAKNNIERKFLSILKKSNEFSIKDDVLSFTEDNIVILKASKVKTTAFNKSDVVKENYSKNTVTYQAASRGMFEYVSISKSEVLTSSDRSLQNVSSYTISHEDWELVNSLIDDINRNAFTKLKAPTDKRLSDGAAHATLSIVQGDVMVTTPTFDHGHPPIEIETLVNKVLSVKEKVSKQ